MLTMINLMCMLGGHDSEVANILTLRTLELGEMEAMVEDTSLINMYNCAK